MSKTKLRLLGNVVLHERVKKGRRIRRVEIERERKKVSVCVIISRGNRGEGGISAWKGWPC